MDGKTAHSGQCSKSPALTKVIYLILGIHLFGNQCVIIKWMLRSERLKQHVVSIGFDQSLSNSEIYEHRCLEYIKKL